jgi:hypothetical protein
MFIEQSRKRFYSTISKIIWCSCQLILFYSNLTGWDQAYKLKCFEIQENPLVCWLQTVVLAKLEHICQRPFWEKCDSPCQICASNDALVSLNISSLCRPVLNQSWPNKMDELAVTRWNSVYRAVLSHNFHLALINAANFYYFNYGGGITHNFYFLIIQIWLKIDFRSKINIQSKNKASCICQKHHFLKKSCQRWHKHH